MVSFCISCHFSFVWIGLYTVLKERFKELQDRLLSETKTFYGEALVSVVVFGSIGRGTQTFDSDVDVLIIARNLPHGRIKRVRAFETVENNLVPFLKGIEGNGINSCISPIFKTPEETEKGSPLFLDMVEDAHIMFDRDNYFSTFLKQFKDRLHTLGAKRVWMGNAWYWNLKPDYKPGEVFEL